MKGGMCFVELTKEFLMIYDKSPSRLQKKITEPIKMQVWIFVGCMWSGNWLNRAFCFGVCVCVCVCVCRVVVVGLPAVEVVTRIQRGSIT